VAETNLAPPHETAVGSPRFRRSFWPLSWRLYWHTVEGTWKAFGLSNQLLVYSVRRPIMTAAMRLCLALDHVFVPAFRKTAVTAPVFLIGHPRSGTTFVHRLLTQTREFSVFEFWEILVPSLIGRALARPMIKRLAARGSGVMIPKETGHLGALDEVEEEELLFLHTGNTQFTALLSPLAFSDWDFAELVWADEQAPADRRRAMRFLRGCLQRQLHATNLPRAVTKMNFSAMRIRSLLEEFPDAKFVYIQRSPLETIPSHLTLHRNIFNHLWGLERIPPRLLERYYQRRYRHNVEFYQHLESVLDERAIPESNLLAVRYDDLLTDLDATMQRIIDFTELPCSPRLRELIAEQARSQSSYRRAHKNLSLEEFGLTLEQIEQDFAFYFEKHGRDGG
jgi:hypothetical protein